MGARSEVVFSIRKGGLGVRREVCGMRKRLRGAYEKKKKRKKKTFDQLGKVYFMTSCDEVFQALLQSGEGPEFVVSF